MRCLHCGKRLSLLRKLQDAEFCSDEHKLAFQQQQSDLALSRLIESQKRIDRPARAAGKPAAVSLQPGSETPPEAPLAALRTQPRNARTSLRGATTPIPASLACEPPSHEPRLGRPAASARLQKTSVERLGTPRLVRLRMGERVRPRRVVYAPRFRQLEAGPGLRRSPVAALPAGRPVPAAASGPRLDIGPLLFIPAGAGAAGLEFGPRAAAPGDCGPLRLPAWSLTPPSLAPRAWELAPAAPTAFPVHPADPNRLVGPPREPSAGPFIEPALVERLLALAAGRALRGAPAGVRAIPLARPGRSARVIAWPKPAATSRHRLLATASRLAALHWQALRPAAGLESWSYRPLPVHAPACYPASSPDDRRCLPPAAPQPLAALRGAPALSAPRGFATASLPPQASGPAAPPSCGFSLKAPLIRERALPVVMPLPAPADCAPAPAAWPARPAAVALAAGPPASARLPEPEPALDGGLLSILAPPPGDCFSSRTARPLPSPSSGLSSYLPPPTTAMAAPAIATGPAGAAWGQPQPAPASSLLASPEPRRADCAANRPLEPAPVEPSRPATLPLASGVRIADSDAIAPPAMAPPAEPLPRWLRPEPRQWRSPESPARPAPPPVVADAGLTGALPPGEVAPPLFRRLIPIQAGRARDNDLGPVPLVAAPIWPHADTVLAFPRGRLRTDRPDGSGPRLDHPLPAGQGWQVPGLSGATRFWRHAPADLKWIGVGLPLVLLLVLYSALPAGPPPPSERAAAGLPSASDGVRTSLTSRLSGIQAAITRRAAINLTDDFRSGLSAWDGSGDWAKSWTYDEAGFLVPGVIGLYSPTLHLADYTLEFLGHVERRSLNWVIRARDSRNYYAMRLVITSQGPMPKASIVRYAVIDGKEGPVTTLPLPMTLNPNMLFRIRVDVKGNAFTTWMSGQVVDNFTDSRLARGGIGFFSPKGDRSRLRWVEVSHQYDFLGRLCALLAPYSVQAEGREAE